MNVYFLFIKGYFGRLASARPKNAAVYIGFMYMCVWTYVRNRDFASRTHNPIITFIIATKKCKTQVSRSSSIFVFFMKIKAVEDRKSTVGSSIYQQNRYSLQPTRAALYQRTVLA
jgi:hypothetical protein